MKAEQKEKDENKKAVVASLAFRVKADGDNLFSAEMLLILDDIVVGKRHGVSTTLGHAIAMADELLDGWAFSEIESKAKDYFETVLL